MRRILLALAAAAILVGAAWAGLRLFRLDGLLAASHRPGRRVLVVVADVANSTGDPVLGHAVTEAMRIDLAQSSTLTVLDHEALAAALERIARPPGAEVDAATAREVAEREGANAYVVGRIEPLGSGFTLSAYAATVAAHELVVPLREDAASEGDVLRAVDRLSASLRQRLGESLKANRASQPLEHQAPGGPREDR